MRILIGNTVKTDFGEYPCATREEAEALFRSLEERAANRAEPAQDEDSGGTPPPAGRPLDS